MSSEDGTTRLRLLRAAEEVFSESGYKGATVRKICRRAGVGVALVNYHFRDKEGLYLEVYRDMFRRAIQEYPPGMGLGDDPSPEERLHAFIRSFLYRLSMVGDRRSLIMRELLDPLPSVAVLHGELVEPLQNILIDIIRDLLKGQACPDRVRHCATSVIGQCVFYAPHSLRFRECAVPARAEEGIESIARCITAFSLGGIQALRDENILQGNTP